MRRLAALIVGCFSAACGGGNDEAGGNGPPQGAGGSLSGSGGGTGGTTGVTTAANADGDCLSDEQEGALGTNPGAADTDGDGVGDCEEVACVSDPLDAAERCYACGWKHNDPGNLVATGNQPGDVIQNIDLVDQCDEPLRLWDFAQEYHILFMTAAW